MGPRGALETARATPRRDPRNARRASRCSWASARAILLQSLIVSAIALATADGIATETPGVPALDGVGTSGDGDGVPGDAVRPGESGAEVRRIRFGDKVALDELGPIIVNEDCTMRRIANWETLSPRERRGVQKRVVRRNEERLERCRALEAEGKLPRARGDGDGDGDGDIDAPETGVDREEL